MLCVNCLFIWQRKFYITMPFFTVNPVDRDLTNGPVTSSMLLFVLPMIVENLLQQRYNIADTLIVGRFLGQNALAVGVVGIRRSVPISRFLADAAGLLYYFKK